MKHHMLPVVWAILCLPTVSNAQQGVGIGTNSPSTSSLLEISSNSKGILIPRVTLLSNTDVTTVPYPVNALLVYNNNPALPDGRGFYYWNSLIDGWTRLATNTNLNNISYWSHTGNNNTDPLINFIGTTDNKALVFKTNNILSGKIDPGPNNVFLGQSAGIGITSGTNNTFLGHHAGITDTSGSNNLFVGHLAGNLNSSGNENVFVGQDAGKVNTTGSRNVFVGEDAGISNTEGSDQVFIGNGAGRNYNGTTSMIAIGSEAMGTMISSLTTNPNLAIGYHALQNGISGPNTVIGYEAMKNSTSAYQNTALGYGTLKSNTTGSRDIAIGHLSLNLNTTGIDNTAIGGLDFNTTGNYNTGTGNGSLNSNTTGDNNTGMGYNSLLYNTTGSNNSALGYYAGPTNGFFTLSNTTCIGANAEVYSSNTIVFGDENINKWAFGIPTTSSNHVIEVGNGSTNGNGAYLTQGGTWTNTSSKIKKEDFSDVNGLELLQKILQIPIQKWKYKGTNEYHIGPVAEDFYKLFGLGTDDKGISTVDPAGIALTAIKEQQKMIIQLQEEINKLKSIIQQNK